MQVSDRSSDVVDDHCLIHYFIRVNGRRPSRDELLDLRAQFLTSAGPHHRLEEAGAALPRALRREVARLIHRL